MNPVEAQRSTLRRLLHQAQSTQFARTHGFSQIRTVSDFQARVPLRRYEDYWRDFWSGSFPVLKNISWPGTIPFFALTSGTTSGRSKYIPVSKEMIRSNRRAALRVLMHHVRSNPNSRLFEGKMFLLGGAIDLNIEAPGIQSGDLSGISTATIPWWFRLHSYPPRKTALIFDWEERMDVVSKDPRSRDITAIGGQTPWLLAHMERAFTLKNNNNNTLAETFPLLELIICGGVNFSPYEHRFEAIMKGQQVALREVYAASEGFIAIGNGHPGNGMNPLLDNGLFFEFVPLEEIEASEPTRHWMETVEPNIDYAVAISSNSGLWAYLIGDIIRFKEVEKPCIVVTGRTGQALSAFGERLIEAEIVEAVTKAADVIGKSVQEFVVGPVFPSAAGETGRHLYIVEFSDPPSDAALNHKFSEKIDSVLKEINLDYFEMRSGGLVIDRPELLTAPPGTFYGWMKKRGKLGGQNKVPRILLDQVLFEDLRRFASRGVGR
jgi:hypothetical protein